MNKCPKCGREFAENEVCNCEIEITNDIKNEEKNRNISNFVGTNYEEKKEESPTNMKTSQISEQLNKSLNLIMKYIVSIIKFAVEFMKSPTMFLEKIIAYQDIKTGLVYLGITFILLFFQNIIAINRGIDLLNDLVSAFNKSIFGIPSFSYRIEINGWEVFSKMLFGFGFLYIIFCGIYFGILNLFKEKTDFKAIVAAVGVNFIPIGFAALGGIILQFISFWLLFIVWSFLGLVHLFL
ncbi:hypothetical protein [Caldicellulosiruptor naganoensis]|uniref:Yip1 domain-containing protein n=1 Tax=Caldicellulosiruptor naganoensis TaxID=29324 RepID=A0ABY7BI15_9FIRM|nr:hypothetical protein [Caldicellulosiruptor naganoensis]WAM31987.1 hypothetical protein OTJ99_000475 [Caldicellulosiruptor naganoensis]